MAGQKEIRTRIASVHSTRQITSAMKIVSAAKLRKAQDAVISMRPFSEKLHDILVHLCTNLETFESTYTKQRPLEHVLLVAITSNRGLCGAFNTNVIRTINHLAYEKYKGHHLSVLCIGKKAADYYRKRPELKLIGTDLPRSLNALFDQLTYEQVSPVAEWIMRTFAQHDTDRVELVYNRFISAGVQKITVEQYLPVLPPSSAELNSALPDYIFEPDRESIFKELIPKSLKIQLFKALRESYAAEHGARMTAMHKATDNADELLKELRLSYNKARQDSITRRLIEIVSGSEALKG